LAAFNRVGPHLVVRNFFSEPIVARLLEYAERQREAFKHSTVGSEGKTGNVDPSTRVSHVFRPIKEFKPMVIERVEGLLGEINQALGGPPLAPTSYEIELVAHGHGAFYAQHIDTMTKDDDRTTLRVVSMVYYFCATPARFSGGQLRLHSLAASREAGTYVDIEPENDTAVFFPSWFPHEVLPVVCESGQFMDSRFAINCWLLK